MLEHNSSRFHEGIGCFLPSGHERFGRAKQGNCNFAAKKDGAVDIKDYRPISLVHGVIKIFDKVLATRLATELPFLVGNHQSAFIKGRSIHDNFMLVQCTARRLHALREPAVMLKMDISKAFDSVQWPFLVEVLKAMGFGPRWVDWIYGLLSTSSTRIMVNGTPGRPILNQIGLRQGDPISPMLFIMIMEPLHHMFELATPRGMLAPLAISGMKHRLSMFADDVVFFTKPNELDLCTCALLLKTFGEASGLKINLAKSAAFPIRCPAEMMKWWSGPLAALAAPSLASIWGCPSPSESSPQCNFRILWISWRVCCRSGRQPRCPRVEGYC